jgi:hypothetical protein
MSNLKQKTLREFSQYKEIADWLELESERVKNDYRKRMAAGSKKTSGN